MKLLFLCEVDFSCWCCNVMELFPVEAAMFADDSVLNEGASSFR